MLLACYCWHNTTDAVQNIYGWIMIAGSQCPAEDDMSIQNTAHSITDRFVEIVTFHQNCEEASDGTSFPSACAFEEARQHRKHGWGITFTGRWFTDGKTNLALRHSITSDRIHHEHHIHTLITKILGDRHRDHGSLQT